MKNNGDDSSDINTNNNVSFFKVKIIKSLPSISGATAADIRLHPKL